MKALLLALVVLVVLWFAAPVVAAPDCPPPTAVTLADVEGSGPWYVWLGALALVALVAFAAGVIIGEAREAERERMRQRMDTAMGALRGQVR